MKHGRCSRTSPAWVNLSFHKNRLHLQSGGLTFSACWHCSLPRHVEVKVGMREAKPISLPGLPKATGNYEILQQCLTEKKTLVLLLDKRINKIKRLSNHQWKIACHFNSTLKHEARQAHPCTWAAMPLSQLWAGVGAAVLSCSSIVQLDRHRCAGISHYMLPPE